MQTGTKQLEVMNESYKICLSKGAEPMVSCPECSRSLSPIITGHHGKHVPRCRYTCSCGFNSEFFPVVKGVPVKRNLRSRVVVLVTCPFCGKHHYHSTKSLPGLRKSHCGGLDSKIDKMLEKYLQKYPLAHKGGTYYIALFDWLWPIMDAEYSECHMGNPILESKVFSAMYGRSKEEA